jgi:capsular polysaccharide transport system permease protein
MLHLSASDEAAADRGPPLLARFAWFTRRTFLFLVIVPTLIASRHLLLVASYQYRSEAQFIVRGISTPGPKVNGVGQLLGVTGALAPGQQEAQSVREYLRSHDAIAALRKKGIDLVAIYRRDGVDPLSRLWSSTPKAETLLDYYRSHVDVLYDPDDNITRLSVRAFRPGDARAITAALLKLGEERVNAFNARLFDASQRTASTEMDAAERDLADVQGKLGAFREVSGDIDPTTSGEGGQRSLQLQQVELDRQRAVLADMRRQLSASSPQVRAMQGRVAALETALGATSGRLTGQPRAVSARLGNFEDLKLQQDFAAKRYEAARARFEEERARAEKERLFIIPVVEPNLPEKPTLPKPWQTSLLIFIGLSVAYGIGWMLLAGVREHQS